jgi:hypothetical protein
MQSEFTSYELEEIEILQNVINRTATNSLIIRGWALVVFFGIVLLLNAARNQALVGAFALLVFWYLDAYYLWQEKTYQALHKEIVQHKLDTGDGFFDLKTARREAAVGVPRPSELMLSKRLVVFYGALFTLPFAYAGILTALLNGG